MTSNISSLKALSMRAYHKLEPYNVPSYYKLCAISRAAVILTSRRKSLRRGMPTKSPYVMRRHLTSCYGFKFIGNAIRIPVGHREFFEIELNKHTQEILSDPALRVRSFTLTNTHLSICYSKDVQELECADIAGLDRNLRNITYGNDQHVVKYNLSEAVKIARRTSKIIASFKRKDMRIRKRIASKYGRRQRNRVNQLLHNTTKDIVERAFAKREAIVLEDIRGIRKLYRKGNGQSHRYRGIMNAWSFCEVQRQIEYKAKWKGIPVMRLSKEETMGTSTLCPICGERLLNGQYISRQLWCPSCGMKADRDIVAVLNQSHRGRVRFARSLPCDDKAKGGAAEAMRGNPLRMEVILRVDAPKSSHDKDLTEPKL